MSLHVKVLVIKPHNIRSNPGTRGKENTGSYMLVSDFHRHAVAHMYTQAHTHTAK